MSLISVLEALGGRPIETRPPASARRMRALLERHDNPDASFSNVVVAGTVGKGSTAAVLAALLQAHGHRVGLFTGPHLERYNERIRVNGRDIGERPFACVLRQALTTATEFARRDDPAWRPSVLEVLALAACLHFHANGIEWAVMEAGVGGARDYTMALNARATVLTQVGLDHMHLLGQTIEEIAREKMAIARPEIPLICAARAPEARKMLTHPTCLIGRDFEVQSVEVSLEGTSFDLGDLRELHVPLIGAHQADNAAAAITCLRDLADRRLLEIDKRRIRLGLKRARMPGRLERFPGPPEIILDGAHQPEGARALRKTLQEICGDRYVALVLGVLADKDRAGVIEALAPAASALILTQPPWASRTGSLEEFAAGKDNACVIEDPLEVLEHAKTLAIKKNGLVCVAGSLYLAGVVRAQLCGARHK